MITSDPTLNDYIHIARIYTDGKLTEQQLMGKAEQYQRDNKYKTVTLGFLSYLRREFNLPIRFWPEIIKLKRRLSPLEVEALRLKEKVQKEPGSPIHVSIDELE